MITQETQDLLDTMYQLAVDARVRTGSAKSDYKRANMMRLRRAVKNARLVARAAAELAATAFRAVDAIETELRRARYRHEYE